MNKMSWNEAFDYMRQYNDRRGYKVGNRPTKFCNMIAVLKPSAMIDPNEPEENRTYTFNNDNKAFISGMLGYSVFARNKGTGSLERIEDVKNEDVEYVYIESEED